MMYLKSVLFLFLSNCTTLNNLTSMIHFLKLLFSNHSTKKIQIIK